MKYRVIFLMIVLLVPFTSVVADNHQAQVLLLYGSDDDRSTIEGMLVDQDIDLTSIAITEVQSSDIGDQHQIILASSEEFSMEDPVELALQTYLQDPDHQLVMISPYLNEFEDEMETALGVEGTLTTENDSLEWTINPVKDFVNISTSDQFSYTGNTAIAQLTSTAQVLANFTNVVGDPEVTDDIPLPSPAVWNVTVDARVYVVGTSLTTGSAGLGLDQTGDFIETVVKQIVISTVQSITRILDNNGSDPGQGTEETDPGDPNNDEIVTIPITNIGLTVPELSLIGALFAMFALLYSKIIGAINWLIRKFYGVLIAVIGAFYNVQDRTLSHSEVLMNNSRADILAYLNHVGSYGAHIRELKNVTNTGSGSLLWHLQVLEDYGLIEKYTIESYTIFVGDGYTFDPQLKKIELNLQSKYILDLLDVLAHATSDRISLSVIEQQTGIKRRPLRRLLNKLADDDLVEIEKYPEMTVNIAERNMITDLFHSFNLRDSFSFDEENPSIEYME